LADPSAGTWIVEDATEIRSIGYAAAGFGARAPFCSQP
jgi:hypothetical protein